MESVLLLFDQNHPCWTRELVEKAGEDPHSLDLLHQKGDLKITDNIFSLTSQGIASYHRAAQESFYDVPPGEEHSASPGRSVLRTELEQLLDRSFWGRWGIKEFRAGTRLPYLPDLPKQELFKSIHGNLRWTFYENSAVRTLTKRYPAPVSKNIVPPDLKQFEAWTREWGLSWGNLPLDLLFLHHYDSEHFRHLPPQPNDRLGLFHTDHFYFQLLPQGIPPMETLWEEMGRLHLFILNQRRIFLPWYFNFDTTGYDAANWWFWVTSTEEELGRLSDFLEPVSARLVEPSLPLELFGISLEALKQIREKREYHWDLFEEIAVSLSPRL